MLTEVFLIAFSGFLGDVALHAPTDLVAAAAATGRPRECMPVKMRGPKARVGLWSKARVPNLSRYCSLIAHAHARIDENPLAARKAAEEADKLIPDRAAPAVVKARVALQLGDSPLAQKSFGEALARDPRGVEQPVAMHDLAVSQKHAGQLEDALQTYRVLVPRASLLPSRNRRARVLIEAAHLAMTVAAAQPSESSRMLDEAIAYLREASRDPHHAFELDVALSLVLALDRTGRKLQADAILAEQRGSGTWVPGEAIAYVADVHDLHVLRGLSLEKHNRAAANQHYRQYLDANAKGPYAAAVKARLSAPATAEKKPRKRRPR